MAQEIVYSEERGTWNLFVDGEWYYEGTYEQVETAFWNNVQCENEQYEYVNDDWEG